MSYRSVALLVSMMLTACACAGCADRPSNPGDLASAGACHMRVIVTFTQNLGQRPADSVVTEISRAANVMLVFVRSAGPGLYVFQLDGGATDESCRLALARLRADERVRSVDIDRRRHVQEQGTAAPATGLRLNHSNPLEVRDA